MLVCTLLCTRVKVGLLAYRMERMGSGMVAYSRWHASCALCAGWGILYPSFRCFSTLGFFILVTFTTCLVVVARYGWVGTRRS